MKEMQNNTKDEIAVLDGSVIQHGKLSDRIYVMDFAAKDIPLFIEKLETLASQKGYSKIFIKAPLSIKERLLDAGFCQEAEVPHFYPNECGGFFSKFRDPARAVNRDDTLTSEVLRVALSKANEKRQEFDGNLELRRLGKESAKEIAAVYRQVFATYPFPIFDPEYIKKTMNESVAYFGAWQDKKLIAVCSAEINKKYGNAEMTDFATLPSYRGKGLASMLLSLAEQEMKGQNLRLLYTIARARSFGMNITFAREGYTYAGTLVNNTNIAGGIETMNVWYKAL